MTDVTSERKTLSERLADALMTWPLPCTLVSDECVTDPNYKFGRSGTNLMDVATAVSMFEALLAIVEDDKPRVKVRGNTPCVEHVDELGVVEEDEDEPTLAKPTVAPESDADPADADTERQDSESNLVWYARKELDRAFPTTTSNDPDEKMDLLMKEGILRVVKAFSEEGHSGFSASIAIACLKNLLRYEPLTPLTGDDDEWMEAGTGVFQNARCSKVFKQADSFGGQPYTIYGYVFRDSRGTFTGEYSPKPISFPYTPQEATLVDVRSLKVNADGTPHERRIYIDAPDDFKMLYPQLSLFATKQQYASILRGSVIFEPSLGFCTVMSKE